MGFRADSLARLHMYNLRRLALLLAQQSSSVAGQAGRCWICNERDIHWRKAGLDGHTALSASESVSKETSNLLPASCWSLSIVSSMPAGKHWNRLLIFFTFI